LTQVIFDDKTRWVLRSESDKWFIMINNNRIRHDDIVIALIDLNR
jgi:hypothetical protein